MQKSTGKELAVRKTQVRDLLKEVIQHHKLSEAARRAVDESKDLAMDHAWKAGKLLNKIKEILGHGNFMDWLESNFTGSRQTAELYMRIDTQNPNCQRVGNLNFDTIRKYAIGFVPEKDQPEHKGNTKFGRSVSFLNLVNEFDRLEYRHVSGLQLVDFDEAREETKKLYQFLKWLQGDSEENPWLVSSPAHAAVAA